MMEPVIVAATEQLRTGREVPGSVAASRPRYLGQLLTMAVVVAVLRWTFAADRTVFQLLPDEAAQLAMARWLGGGTPWSLYDHSTWQPAFAMLLSPGYWFTSDANTIYRIAIALNALLGAAGAVILYHLARRLTDLAPRTAMVVAGGVALVPSALSGSAHVWAEPLVTLTFLAAVLGLMRYLDQPSPIRAVVPIGVSLLGYLSHGRMLPMLVLSTAIVVGHALRSRLWQQAGLAAAAAVIGWRLVDMFVAEVQRAVWTLPGRTNSAGSTLRRLEHPAAVLDAFVGQLWYQLVTTATLVGVGVVVLMCRLRRPDHESGTYVRRDAAVVLATTMPMFAVSVVFTAGRDRTDYMIYGRYTDALTWPLLVVAAAWLLHAANRRAAPRVFPMVAVLGFLAVASAGYVQWRHGDNLAEHIGVRAMVPGLVAFVGDRKSIDVVAPTAIGLAIVLILVLVVYVESVSRRWLAVVGGAVLLMIGAHTWYGLGFDLNFYASSEQVVAVRDLVPAGETIGYHFVPPDEPSQVFGAAQRRGYQLYQMYLPDYEIVVDRGLDDDVGPYVFAPRLDPELTAAGATVLWESTDIGMTLWLEPTAP